MVHRDLYHGGVKLVSVTSLQAIVSKPFLDSWKESLCEESVCGFVAARKVAEEAAEFSNVIHADVAAYLTSGVENNMTWSRRIIDKMKEENVVKYLVEPEETLRCNEANLSGSPDHVAKDAKGSFIGDIKIKKSMDVLTGCQGYGYRLLIRKVYGEDIKRMVIWWGDKKTDKLKIKEYDLDEYKKPFEALVTIWNVVNPARGINLVELK